MRKFLLTAAVVLSLGGCATTSGAPINVTDVTNLIKQICGFVPDAGVIAAVITAGNPITTTVSGVANAICAVVTNKSVRQGAAAPIVNGVPVTGHFNNGQRIGARHGAIGGTVSGVPITGHF